MTEHSDLELIDLVKTDKDPSLHLVEIIQRHSGIYLDIINTYASRDSAFIDRTELIRDKDYYIYQAVVKYDPTRGAKFSTYLGNETKWLCLNIYNKNKRHPTITTETLDLMSPKLELYSDSSKESLRKDSLTKVMQLVKAHPDKRVGKIFKMRYIIGKRNKVMPWKNVGKRMNLSIQGCINIHNSAIKSIRETIKDKEDVK
tara:strand:+ start:199 stop:801 length:603 start_codon:yes stop_codon:yes gene_type:complete